jgi:hypothetical protein
MRRALLLSPFLLLACDEKPAAQAIVDAAPTMAMAAVDAAPRAPTWEMPERPVPKSSPTVTSTMPPEVQMKAIGYMNAMGQVHAEDAPADAEYAKNLATTLKPLLLAADKGSAEEKSRLNRVEIIAGGRRIDLLAAAGCDAQMPARVVAGAASLSMLQAHGVLVIACHDARVQCLQSTRDPSDILCTTAPRHK